MLMIKRFAEMKCINVKKKKNKHKNCLVKINFRLHKKTLGDDKFTDHGKT